MCLCGSERSLVLCQGGGSITPGILAPVCAPPHCRHRAGPRCQRPQSCSVHGREGLSPELWLCQPWQDLGQSLARCNPSFWGASDGALPAGQDVVQRLPFPCLCPAPGPGSVASGRIALFVPLDVLHFLRKQPIVLAGNPSLSWGQPGGTLVLFCGAPSSLLWGGQPPLMPLNTARTGVGSWP